MFLQVQEIPRDELKHLYCTDPALKSEVEAINRSIRHLDERVSNLDTNDAQPSREEVMVWPVL